MDNSKKNLNVNVNSNVNDNVNQNVNNGISLNNHKTSNLLNKLKQKVLLEESMDTSGLDKTCKYITPDLSKKIDSNSNLSDVSSILSQNEKQKLYNNKIQFKFDNIDNSKSITFNFETALEACPILANYNEELPWTSKVTI